MYIFKKYINKKYRKIGQHQRGHSKSTSLAKSRFLSEWHLFLAAAPPPTSLATLSISPPLFPE